MRTIVITIVLLLIVNWPAAGNSRRSSEEVKADAQRSLSQILDLWRDGKYAELYERTRGGRVTREAFARRLTAAPLRPACCWEKMQDVTVRVEREGTAVVKAKLGFEGKGGTEFKTGSFKLVYKEDVWSISRADLFFLAGTPKKRATYRSLREAESR